MHIRIMDVTPPLDILCVGLYWVCDESGPQEPLGMFPHNTFCTSYNLPYAIFEYPDLTNQGLFKVIPIF